MFNLNIDQRSRLFNDILDDWAGNHDADCSKGEYLSTMLSSLEGIQRSLTALADSEFELDTQYAKNKEELTDSRTKIQHRCGHRVKKTNHDPSGNRDSSIVCLICGLEIKSLLKNQT